MSATTQQTSATSQDDTSGVKNPLDAIHKAEKEASDIIQKAEEESRVELEKKKQEIDKNNLSNLDKKKEEVKNNLTAHKKEQADSGKQQLGGIGSQIDNMKSSAKQQEKAAIEYICKNFPSLKNSE